MTDCPHHDYACTTRHLCQRCTYDNLEDSMRRHPAGRIVLTDKGENLMLNAIGYGVGLSIALGLIALICVAGWIETMP